MGSKRHSGHDHDESSPIFGSVERDLAMPSAKLNPKPIEPQIAYEMVHQYLSIEGNATQNLATFCQTYMEPTAELLMGETMDKNAIDKDEYPLTADLENRCVAMIGDLWNADAREEPLGTSTVGSSEACMLGGLALLFRWKARADAAGIDRSALRPNLVISAGYQVCWEKFCRYWDIEMRAVPLDGQHLSLDVDAAISLVDDCTIGIIGILGITYTGRFDDIARLDRLVDTYNRAHPDMPVSIHVDAASGGMIAPFLKPELVWDFRCHNVVSINTSGHKYGLVYPGIGWIVWRGKDLVPEDLIFRVSYLGGEEATMAINFSRSAAQIVGQYYVFLRNGFEGFREIHRRTMDVASYLAGHIEQVEYEGRPLFTLLEDTTDMPIICWRLADGADVPWTLYDLSDRLRMHGWLVPAYPMPEKLQDMVVQRVVARQDFSMQLCLRLLDDIATEVTYLGTARFLGDTGVGAHTRCFDHGGRPCPPAD